MAVTWGSKANPRKSSTVAPRPTAEPAAASSPVKSSRSRMAKSFYASFYSTPAIELVDVIRLGVPASFVNRVAGDLSWPKDKLYASLRLPRATIARKVAEGKNLSSDETSRIVGLARLIGRVQSMLGDPSAETQRQAAEFVSRWLDEPLPALAGKRPGELLDTSPGLEVVEGLIAQMESGAYA